MILLFLNNFMVDTYKEIFLYLYFMQMASARAWSLLAFIVWLLWWVQLMPSISDMVLLVKIVFLASPSLVKIAGHNQPTLIQGVAPN